MGNDRSAPSTSFSQCRQARPCQSKPETILWCSKRWPSRRPSKAPTKTEAGRSSVQVMKTSRFLLRGFRRPREIACFALGKLEREVLEETWRLGEISVRDIHRAFDERIAYTTIMTTLDRLFKKNLLARLKDGRAFLYSAVVSSEDFDRSI